MDESRRDAKAVGSRGEVTFIDLRRAKILDVVESRGSEHSVQGAGVKE